VSMAWIRKTYGVPAKRGGRVLYTGSGRAEYGTIKSARGRRLNIQLDGTKHTMPFHPTWSLSYIADSPTPPDPGHGREGELPANPEAMRDPARGLDAAIDAHLRESDKRAVADG